MRALLAVLALLILGAVAFARLPMDYLPRQSFPELTIGLRLPDSRDPEEVTRDWLVEIESAVRSLGRVRGTDGQVRPDGAEMRVRFSSGTDPGRKAARLEAELSDLRRRLPAGAFLSVEPAARVDGDLLAIVWLTGAAREEDAERAAETLRSIPGVQSVQVLGTGQEEVRAELHAGIVDPRATAAAVRAAVESSLRAPDLGRVCQRDREIAVLSPPANPETLAFLPVPARASHDIGVLPLGSLATITERRGAPQFRVRLQGRPAFALFVTRAHGAPLLATDHRLRERVASLPAEMRGQVDWSEAEPLRDLLGRLVLGSLLASLVAAIAGWWLAARGGALSLGLAIPAAAAAAANAFWLAGIPLHVLTLIALALGVAAVLPAAALRLGRPDGTGFAVLAWTLVAAAVTVPVAIPLAGIELEPLLGEPARAFLFAATAAVLAAAVLPRERTRPAPSGIASLQRRTLRDPGTALLGLATAGLVAVTLFGGSLVPLSANLSPDAGRFTLFLPLPEGSTLEESALQVRVAEEVLARTPEIAGFWSSAQAGRTTISAEVHPRDRHADRLTTLATRLRYQIPGAAAARIDTGQAAAGGGDLRLDVEERAETHEEGFFYKVVLRSADLGALRAAHDRLLDRLGQTKVRPHWVTAWEPPTRVLGLRPSLATSPATASGLATALREASRPPAAVPLPPRDREGGGEGIRRALVVVPAGAPLDPELRVPAVGALLGRAVLLDGRTVSPAASLTLRDEIIQPRVTRQSGRFVLPIEVQIALNSEALRLTRLQEIHRSLGQLALPPGVDLERPELSAAARQRERLRRALPVVILPLLLLAVAACRLGAPWRALAVLVPLAAGAVAATPAVRSGLGQIDEPGLFALAAVLALTLAPAAELAGAGALPRGSGEAPGRLWRALRQETPWLLAATLPLVLLLALPTLGADPIRYRWVVPLRVAATAAGVALLCSALIIPPLRLTAARWRSRDAEETRCRRQPPAWSEPGPPTLEVRGVTKVYGSGRASNIRALSAMSFHLEPGIVGLLGPNGAGKTTLLRVLTGLLDPTRGHVLFRGVPVSADNLAEYRLRIGFLPQELNAYPEFTAERFLDHWALERGLTDPRTRRAEVERWLAAVDLTEHANRRVRDFSGGMRQRVGIARALLGAPPILIVDEPTTGLDVESRSRFRQILLEQAADRIVLFSTHIASDVEAAARRILLLHRGRLRFDGTADELVERARGRVFRTLVDDAALAGIGRDYRITARVRRLEGIEIRGVARPNQELAGEAVEPSLEEAYLAEIGLAETGADSGPGGALAFLDRSRG